MTWVYMLPSIWEKKNINGEYIDLGLLLDKASTEQANMLEVNASGQPVVKQKFGENNNKY